MIILIMNISDMPNFTLHKAYYKDTRHTVYQLCTVYKDHMHIATNHNPQRDSIIIIL